VFFCRWRMITVRPSVACQFLFKFFPFPFHPRGDARFIFLAVRIRDYAPFFFLSGISVIWASLLLPFLFFVRVVFFYHFSVVAGEGSIPPPFFPSRLFGPITFSLPSLLLSLPFPSFFKLLAGVFSTLFCFGQEKGFGVVLPPFFSFSLKSGRLSSMFFLLSFFFPPFPPRSSVQAVLAKTLPPVILGGRTATPSFSSAATNSSLFFPPSLPFPSLPPTGFFFFSCVFFPFARGQEHNPPFFSFFTQPRRVNPLSPFPPPPRPSTFGSRTRDKE